MSKPLKAIFTRPCRWLILALLTGTVGCSGRPPAIKSPKWRPEPLADKAMEQCDQNGDGKIDASELDAAPGLKAGLSELDTNGDQAVSRDELVQRFDIYAKSRAGQSEEYLEFTYKGQPLAGAKVVLQPEPFLDGLVEPADGVVTSGGGVIPDNHAVENSRGIRLGYYRIHISDAKEKIPEKYGENTTLGVEISPTTKDGGYSDLRFDLQ